MKIPGASICFHCPLPEHTCETSSSNPTMTRCNIIAPRCLQDYAIWRLNKFTPSTSLTIADGIVSSVTAGPDGLIDVDRYKAALQAEADKVKERPQGLYKMVLSQVGL